MAKMVTIIGLLSISLTSFAAEVDLMNRFQDLLQARFPKNYVGVTDSGSRCTLAFKVYSSQINVVFSPSASGAPKRSFTLKSPFRIGQFVERFYDGDYRMNTTYIDRRASVVLSSRYEAVAGGSKGWWQLILERSSDGSVSARLSGSPGFQSEFCRGN